MLRKPEDDAVALSQPFRIGDRVRITYADHEFIDRIGIEATIVSTLERGDDGRMYYRLDNDMSARPECLEPIERHGEAPRDDIA